MNLHWAKCAKTALQVSLQVASAVAMASSETCPIDNSMMWFTGQTRVEMGKMLYLYKCPLRHTAWVVQ